MILQLRVQVVDDEIVVTVPGYRYSATYYKSYDARHLVARNAQSLTSAHNNEKVRVPGCGQEAGQRQGERARVDRLVLASAAALFSLPAINNKWNGSC